MSEIVGKFIPPPLVLGFQGILVSVHLNVKRNLFFPLPSVCGSLTDVFYIDV